MMPSMESTEFKNIIPFGGKAHLYKQFYSREDSYSLFRKINEQIDWYEQKIQKDGEIQTIGRKTSWHSEVDRDYHYGKFFNPRNDFNETLKQIKSDVENFLGLTFNSVLLNYYPSGEASISWHKDKEKALDPNSPVVSLSLGQTRTFKLKHSGRKFRGIISKRLVSGDLLLLDSEMQNHWLHCIPKEKDRKGPRINLTFRNIQKS